MGLRSRHALALVVSGLVHALALTRSLWSFGPSLELPKIELEFAEIEIIDPDVKQGEEPPTAPPAEAAAPVVAPPKPRAAEAKADEPPPAPPEPKAKPEKAFAQKTAAVDQLGPPSSTFSMLLANKRIKKLPFAEETVEIMAPLPDFEYIVQGGGFHPLRDFDYIVIASPNLRDLTQTFLAVQYNVPTEELRRGLDNAASHRSERIEWEERGEITLGRPVPVDPNVPDLDPRWFVFVEDNVALYVREEFLPHVTSGPEADKGKTAGNFVANLSRLKRFAETEPRAGLSVKMRDIRASLRRAKGLPFAVPDDLELSAEAAENPELLIAMRFLTEEDAKGALTYWTTALPQVIAGLPFFIRPQAQLLYDLIRPSLHETRLELRARFETSQAKLLLSLVADGSRRALRRTPEEMAAARAEREAAWKRREAAAATGAVGPATSTAGPDRADPSGAAPHRAEPPLPELAPEPAAVAPPPASPGALPSLAPEKPDP